VRLSRTAVIPAHNEAATIADVVRRTKPHVDHVIVIDDASSDDTAEQAANAGAEVRSSQTPLGYVGALTAGLRAADTEVIVTLDGDGEHPAELIPDLVHPIEEDMYDVVFGQPPRPVRFLEHVIEWLVARRIGVQGTSSGFRAIRKKQAHNLQLSEKCTCAVLVMPMYLDGARIGSVPVPADAPDENRPSQWKQHVRMLPRILRLIFTRRK
jgi:glycosyltransferase involved in cell wall biosynthesis